MEGFLDPTKRYGVAIFDDPKAAKEGWACVAGEDPYFVSNTGDLYTSVTWLTNIDLDTFFKKGLKQTPRLRADNFLRTKVSTILIELGLKHAPVREKALHLAALFDTVMQFSFLHLGINTAPSGMLNNGIRQIILPTETPFQPYISEAAKLAYQPHVLCEKVYTDEEADLVSLVFHRYRYAKTITSYNVPQGTWKRCEEDITGLSMDAIEEWLAERKQPALLCVEITSIHESVNDLVNYGAGAGDRTTKTTQGADTVTPNPRSWMTSHEFLTMAKYANMSVREILVGERFALNPISIPKWGTLTQHSFAFGLFCENLWTSLTRGLDMRANNTPLGAWIHSIDRMYCFEQARLIKESDFVAIHGYGYGRITLQIPKAESSTISDMAHRLKMIAPMNTNPYGTQRTPPVNPSHAEIMQSLMDRGALNFLEQTDRDALHQAKELLASMATRKNLTDMLSI